jgi:hypothetical membrane protein
MDRRALFFMVAAAVCLVLVPVTPSDLRWFTLALAVVYVLLAIGSALDNWSRSRDGRSDP